MSFTLDTIEKSVWEATVPIMDICQTKGPSETDCRNYVMVLQSYGNQLYACGTYAFNPHCSWRQVSFIFHKCRRIAKIRLLFCQFFFVLSNRLYSTVQSVDRSKSRRFFLSPTADLILLVSVTFFVCLFLCITCCLSFATIFFSSHF